MTDSGREPMPGEIWRFKATHFEVIGVGPMLAAVSYGDGSYGTLHLDSFYDETVERIVVGKASNGTGPVGEPRFKPNPYLALPARVEAGATAWPADEDEVREALEMSIEDWAAKRDKFNQALKKLILGMFGHVI